MCLSQPKEKQSRKEKIKNQPDKEKEAVPLKTKKRENNG
jgi:hypothetical protein